MDWKYGIKAYLRRFLVLAVLSVIAIDCTGPREKNEAIVLRKLASETPVYPGFHKTSEQVVLRPGKVYFFNYYQSNAQFSDIKKFYDDVLLEKGWQSPPAPPPSYFVGDKIEPRYRRGDYVIVVEQDDRHRDQFDVVFEWDPE